jgi:type I restriction enzyme S subunit
MSDWTECALSEVADVIPGFAFKGEHFGEHGATVIKIKDITPPTIRIVGAQKVDLANYSVSKLEKFKLRKGDFVVAMTGATIGKVGKLLEETEAYINQRVAKIEPKNDVDRSFVYFCLLNYDFDDFVQNNIDSHSAQENISGSSIGRYPISRPPFPEQKAIAGVLGSLDKKIDLLHRQNKTLEAMAETLFRQWFMEEAEVGWEEKPLSGIASFLNGLACQKYPPENDLERLPVLKIRELSGGISEASEWATSKVKPEYIVNAGDVIFSWSASLMVKVWDGEPCVLNQHLFKVTSDKFPKWFYLMWCKHHLAEFISISSSHATTMGHIKRGDLDAAMVSVPSPKEIEAMSAHMAPLLDKQISIAKQRRTLEKLRDSLLPKLMSGEVRVAA